MTSISLEPPKCMERHVNEEITFRNQMQSPLLRLPAELRNEIYQHTIGGNELHYRGIVGGIKCYWNARPMESTHEPRPLCDRQLLALTQTCRQVYRETKDLVFKQNVFAGRPRYLRALLEGGSNVDVDKIETVHATIGTKFKGRYEMDGEERLLVEMLAKLKNFKRLVVIWNTLHETEYAGMIFFAGVEEEFDKHFRGSTGARCELKFVRDSLLLR